MATPNPHYDPDWRPLRDRHHEERSLAGDELQRLCEAGEIGSAGYEATKAAWERHNAAWRATYRKTIPDGRGICGMAVYDLPGRNQWPQRRYRGARA